MKKIIKIEDISLRFHFWRRINKEGFVQNIEIQLDKLRGLQNLKGICYTRRDVTNPIEAYKVRLVEMNM